MGRSRGFDWSKPGRIDRLMQLREQGLEYHRIAAILSSEFGEEVTQAMVNARYRRSVTGGVRRSVEAPAHAGGPPVTEQFWGRGDKPFPEIAVPPSPMLSADELIKQRETRWHQRKKHEEARSLIPVRMPELAPIGILVHGDPHTDDDGTNLPLLMRNADLVARTPGLFAATVGDAQNNWVGRLVRLYAEQSTTAREAWVITEEWIKRHGRKWLFFVFGNHDMWTGPNDPLQWILRMQAVQLAQEWSVRIALQFPGGPAVRIHCAHDFPGSSMWNPAHAVSKSLRLGKRDHVALCGHRHHFGYQPVSDPETGGLLHALRVGSYKEYDTHARQLGHEGPAYPCVMVTIDPTQPESAPDRIKWFLDPEVGAGYLTFLRSRRHAA